jgi:hypothetical protein
MKVKEIFEKLENEDISVEDFAYGDFNSEELGFGEFKEVEQYGGEGQGDTWYSIKYFPNFDLYIRTDGSYSSYNGTDFYDGYGEEVKPVEKTITVYE